MAKKDSSRTRSSIDQLPEALRAHVNMRLADVNITYADIIEELAAQGYEISKSALGRYAQRIGKAGMRLREATQQAQVLIEFVRENDNVQASELVTTLMLNGLIGKFTTADEEFDEMPLEKAGRLAIQLQRSAVYKERFAAKRRRDLQDAFEQVIAMLQEGIQDDPALMRELVDRARNIEAKKMMEIETDG